MRGKTVLVILLLVSLTVGIFGTRHPAQSRRMMQKTARSQNSGNVPFHTAKLRRLFLVVRLVLIVLLFNRAADSQTDVYFSPFR